MNKFLLACFLPAALGAALPPSLTIYNGGFGVVCEMLPLDLHAGTNRVDFSGVTVHLEPDSVVLRDPAGRVTLQILEQNYRADTISQGLLLALNEGKSLDFLTRDNLGHETIVHGKVVRSGYVPHFQGGAQFGQAYFQAQMAEAGNRQPIIEVNGQLRFSLPGEPIFPALGDDAILQPLLTWDIAAGAAGHLDAELSYVTGGMRWEAAYNLMAPEHGDTLDLIGWVTIDNQTGKTFENARIKLMAGNVNKLPPDNGIAKSQAVDAMLDHNEPVVGGTTEKAFDEFHLYSLRRPTTLRDRETKQVEFVRATHIKAATVYIYRGVDLSRYRGETYDQIRADRFIGTQSNSKVWVLREFVNSAANGLGQPLPMGRTRFYRADEADGRLEFTGENRIDHTPRDETVRIYTGDAFDVVGERVRTNLVVNNAGDAADESFAITIHNHKSTPVTVQIAERLYRWTNWTIPVKSHDYTKTSAQEINFPVTVPASGETVVRYTVHYDWK